MGKGENYATHQRDKTTYKGEIRLCRVLASCSTHVHYEFFPVWITKLVLIGELFCQFVNVGRFSKPVVVSQTPVVEIVGEVVTVTWKGINMVRVA